jgi:hypothetical protein
MLVAALAPFAGRSKLTVFGLQPLTLWGSACLLLLVVLWWDDMSPRIAWNDAGFVARGPNGIHRGTWADARSVFLLGLAGGKNGYRLVIVTPSGRFELLADRFWWMAPISGRHTKSHRALEEIRSARAAAEAHDGVPPRHMPPLAQLTHLFHHRRAPLGAGLLIG